MKYYKVNDLQGCNFMDDTENEPMTLNSLRSRFWALDDVRSEKYKDFTKEFIEDMWEVEFIEVDNIKRCSECSKALSVEEEKILMLNKRELEHLQSEMQGKNRTMFEYETEDKKIISDEMIKRIINIEELKGGLKE